ncbi:MAG: hypothetical protein FD123_1796 [Bacteroidetes bacterium]|nr:MAG: hypothetical protein FD123_1796 [Bacteroidota bacterium]
MNQTEGLYYALGEMLYAIAAADGKIQAAEKEKLKQLIGNEPGNGAGNYTDIIFQVLERDHLSLETAAEWSIRELRLNSQYLTPQMKLAFCKAVEQVAAAFPPVTGKEKKLVDTFCDELASLQGDPVYYESR